MKPPLKLYEFHTANLRMVGAALDHFARAGRTSLAHERRTELESFIRGFALLLGVEAEARLSKLLYESGGFSDSERAAIKGQSTQLERWLFVVETAFRRHYMVAASSPLTDRVLTHSAYHRFTTVCNVLEHDLSPAIRVRNKLAHGQFVYPLNDEGDDVVSELYVALNKENLLTLELKRNLIARLIAAIHDLVVSKPTFERDFDRHYRAFVDARTRVVQVNYRAWEQGLREKAKRGQAKRAH